MTEFLETEGGRGSVLSEADLLDAIVFAVGEGVVVADGDGRLLLLNPAAERLLGPGLQRLFNDERSLGWSVATPDGAEAVTADLPLARALKGEESEDVEVVVRLRRREPVFLSLSGRMIQTGDLRGAVCTVRDVTARRRSDEAAAEAQERFELTFEHAPVGIALVSTDRESLLQVNAAFAKLVGRSPDDLVGRPVGDMVHFADRPIEAELRRRIVAGETSLVTEQVRLTRPEGASVWTQLHVSLVRGADRRPKYVIVQAEDVDERKRFEARLRHLADHDPLTGLLNRRRFQEELALHHQRCRRYGPEGVLVLLDVDGFKDVNDTLGHAVGDEVLRGVAAVLLERLRSTDVIARLGGDEFAVLLPRADAEEARRVSADVVARILAMQHQVADGRTARVSATAGIAAFTGGDLEMRDVLAEADVALYEAKEAGRGGTALYSPQGQQVRIAQRMSWSERIHEALRGEGFVLECQPVYDYSSESVTRHELLLRMREPEGGLAPPARFLPVAEQFGTIRAIDRWVLGQAVELLRTRPRAGGLLVNLSAASLVDANLAAELSAMFESSGVDPARLTVEITETAAIAHMERARSLAEHVRSVGCGLALDDFGAGFASFYYLKHLPVDILKIDGEFIRDVARDAMSQAVVRAVVQTAAAVGTTTIAECVEDEAAFALLRRVGVNAAQGFYVGRPAPLDSFA